MKKSSKQKMRDIGEREFLSQISQFVDEAELDFNDDASAIKLPSGELLVINVDMLVSKTDVLPKMTFRQIGKKAVTMAVSDIIAKGVQPLVCLASIGFPAETEVVKAKDVITGIREQCDYYNVLYLGGDLNESSDIVVDVVSLGVSKDKKIIPRKGARNGDLLFSTGLFGYTSLGFRILLENLIVPSELKKKALLSVYEPIARIDLLHLLQNFPIIICMDSSDGLLVTLSDLSKLNQMGIDVTYVPLSESIRDFSKTKGINPLELAFTGGEEFEMIFAIALDKEDEFLEITKNLGFSIYCIGSFNNSHKEIKIKDELFEKYELPKDGFEHFRINN